MASEVIGRNEEVERLRGFLDASGLDGQRALVLEGEAGIGKSTLWLEGVELARQRGFRVVSSRPSEAERGLAFVGLGDLFEGVLDDVLPALPPPRRRALEVALLLEDAEHALDPRAVAVAVRSAVELLAEPQALVVAVDDVQWLDASSLDALAFAVRRVRVPLLLLLARRLGANVARSRLEVAVPPRTVTRLRIGPLSIGALQTLLWERLERAFSRPTLLRIHETSGGNPFYALELARSLEAGAQAFSVPDSLAAPLRARVARLPVETRASLLLLAAHGSAAVDELQRVGIDENALAPALATEIVALEGADLRFTHPLLASAVYDDSSADERRGVHARLAEVASDPIARARHRALADHRPSVELARQLEQAGTLARRRGATSIAAELGELAAGRTPARAVDQIRRRLLQAARDRLAAGDPDRARALGEDVLAQAAPGAARAEALALRGEIEVRVGNKHVAAGYLRDALAEGPGTPEVELRTRGLLAWSLQDFVHGSIAEAEVHAAAAVELAARVHDPSLSAWAYTPYAATRFLKGAPDGIELGERALELARATGDPDAIIGATYVQGQALLAAGRHDEARGLLLQCHRLSTEYDEGRGTAALLFLVDLEHGVGNWALARTHAERFRELARPDDCLGLALDSFFAAFDGDEAAARSLLHRMLERPECEGFRTGALASLGRLEHWAGESETAVARFDAIERDRQRTGWSLVAFYRELLADYVEALLRVGRIEDAVSVLASWEREAERLSSAWHLAEARRCRGLVAAARGDVEEAIALLEQAVCEHEQVGNDFGRGRTLLSLGTTRRRARRKRAAREALDAARASFDELGAAAWAERARSELGRIGGRQREEGLTGAERRVAALVAEGKTNREVAAALFLAERTVETHLTHIYAKLGVRTRTELARAYEPAP